MSEEDLEVLVTLDDPGEEDLQEDTFDHSQRKPKTVVTSEPCTGGG
jgi:hypothetical protein